MTSEEFEKKQNEAAEETAKEIADLRRSVEDAQKIQQKAHDELNEIKNKFDGKDFMETSAFKEKIAKFEERMDQIDEDLKRMKRTPISIESEDEQKVAAAKAFFKNVHYVTLAYRDSDFAKLWRPTEDELKLLQPHEKQFVHGSVKIPEFNIDAETKAAIVTDHMTRAGAIVGVPEYVTEIIDTAVQEISPIRQYARVRRTTKATLQQPTKTAHAIAYWPGKEAVGTATEDINLEYGLEQIPIHLQVVLWKVSQPMLEDSIFNLNAEFMTEMPEAIDVGEGTAFTNGSGSHEPLGFMADTSITDYRAQGHATTIDNGHALKRLPFDLKLRYSRDGKYYFRRATMGTISVLVDANGQYLLKPLGEKTPWSINGYECVPTPDMPAIDANAYPVVFADLKKGYLIVDKVTGVQLITDPYTSKTTDVVEFLLRRRVGGQPVNAEAFYKLKIATS